MACSIDLRYAIPPLTNLLFRFLHPQIDPKWSHDDNLLQTNHPLIIKLAFFLLVAIVVFLFLLTSVKLLFNARVTANAICLQAGDFSAPVAVSLLCSIFLPHPHFLIAYSIIICISPWHGSLLNLLRQILRRLHHTLQSIPPLNITFINQQEEHPQAEPAQVEIELVEMGRSPQQEQEDLGQDYIVVIDEQE